MPCKKEEVCTSQSYVTTISRPFTHHMIVTADRPRVVVVMYVPPPRTLATIRHFSMDRFRDAYSTPRSHGVIADRSRVASTSTAHPRDDQTVLHGSLPGRVQHPYLVKGVPPTAGSILLYELLCPPLDIIGASSSMYVEFRPGKAYYARKLVHCCRLLLTLYEPSVRVILSTPKAA